METINKQEQQKFLENKREKQRKWSADYRKNHAENWNSYYSGYFKNVFMSKEENRLSHYTRTRINSILSTVKKNNGDCSTLNNESYLIHRNLEAVGWTYDKRDKNLVLNHKLSLQILFKFNNKLSKVVVCDKINLEVCDRLQNTSASKREVTQQTVNTARKMEKKFPEELTGLTNYVRSLKGTLI